MGSDGRVLRILFVCTGNACRSPMAEGIARSLGGDRVAVASAGLHPIGVQPMSVEAMKGIDIDISTQWSKSVEEVSLASTDVLITLCEHAAARLEGIPESIERIHWPTEDPIHAQGEPEEILAVYGAVRDRLRERIEPFLRERGCLQED